MVDHPPSLCPFSHPGCLVSPVLVLVLSFHPLAMALLPIWGSTVVPARHSVSCMVAHNGEPCFLLHYLTSSSLFLLHPSLAHLLLFFFFFLSSITPFFST